MSLTFYNHFKPEIWHRTAHPRPVHQVGCDPPARRAGTPWMAPHSPAPGAQPVPLCPRAPARALTSTSAGEATVTVTCPCATPSQEAACLVTEMEMAR